MRKTIPVIRAASLIPMLKWLSARGRPVEDMLRAAGIGYVWVEDPYAPVPIRALEHMAIQAARIEGPDVGCRMINENSLQDIAALGMIALGARTPREGIAKVSMALPYHCSHEIISMTSGPRETVVHEYWNLTLDPEALHVFQQFVAGIVQVILRRATITEPPLRRLSIIPHPEHGLDHLRRWFPCEIRAAPRNRLDVSILNSVFDAPFRQAVRDREESVENLPWQRLRDGTLSGPARYLIRAMLQEGAPTIERISRAADMSVRTMQRRLGEEGYTFSALVEEVRREAALEALSRHGARIGDVSAHLGYARQSSLSRAVRRWTGQSPLALRGQGAEAAPAGAIPDQIGKIST